MNIPDMDKPEKALRNILLGITDDEMNSKSKGSLAVVSCHTGGGKTNAFCQAMAWMAANMPEDKRPTCIYAVPDLKNIPTKDLKQAYIDYGVEDKFDEVVVVNSRINSYIEMIKDGVDSNDLLSKKLMDIASRDNTLLQESDKKFLEGIQMAEKHHREHKDSLFDEKMRELFNHERGSAESGFRKVISKNLEKEFYLLDPENNKKPKIRQEKKYEEYRKRYWAWIAMRYPWIDELYSARKAKNAKVVIMSTKLLNQKAVLMTETSKTWTRYLEGNLQIVLDESDRAKEVLMDDCIDQTREAYNIFNTHARLLHEAKNALDEETGLKEDQTIGGLNREEWQKFYEGRPNEIDLWVRHIYDPNLDSYGSFIFKFDDVKSGDISGEGNKRVVLVKPEDTRYRVVKEDDYKGEEKTKIHECPSLSGILGTYMGHIRYFCSMVAHGLQKMKNADRDAQEPYVTDSDIKTALSEIHIDRKDGLSNVLSQEIRKELYPCSSKRENLNLACYYTNGISNLTAFNSEDQREITSYDVRKMRETPEGILSRWCGEAHVVLLSATANSSSVLQNFDLKWLRANVPKVIRVRRNLQKKYKEYYQLYNANVKDVNLQVINNDPVYGPFLRYVGEEQTQFDNSNAIEFLAKRGCAEYLENAIIEILSEEDQEKGLYSYNAVRIIRMLLALSFMLNNDDVRYGIIFTNQAFANNSQLLRKIESAFQYLEGYDPECVHFMKTGKDREGNTYEENVKKIKEAVSEGKKRILIGSYKTIGVGQNLQAPIGCIDEKELVFLNDQFEHGRNDVNLNACYLETPTFNLTQGTYKDNYDENMRNIMKIGAEIDSLYLHDEIDRRRRYAAIGTLFETYRKAQDPHTKNKKYSAGFKTKVEDDQKVPPLKSVVLKQMVRILQAIGRLNRSAVKFKNCFVGCDPTCFNGYFEIENLISKDELPSLPEFEKLKAYCRRYRESELLSFDEITDANEMISKNPETQFERTVNNKNHKANNYARKIEENVSNTGHWSAEDIKTYEKLGELVLKHPTVTEEEFINMDESERALIDYFYAYLPENVEDIDRYYYIMNTEEKKKDEIKELSFKPQKDCLQVSMDEARLDEVIKNETIRKAFEEEGIPTQWKPGKWILTPTLLNNFYKGRLGEKITQIVFEKFLDVELKALPIDVYEKYDFWYEGKDGNVVLVDAKHHNDRHLKNDRQEMIKKAHRKLEHVQKYMNEHDESEKALTCLYVNMLHSHQHQYQMVEKYDEQVAVLTGLMTDFERIFNSQNMIDKLKEGRW